MTDQFKKAPITIQLHRCMECGSLSNKVQEVEVIKWERDFAGRPAQFTSKAMVCRECLRAAGMSLPN